MLKLMKNDVKAILSKSKLDFDTFIHICDSWGVDPMLAAAIIQVESGGDPNAMRYEPDYRWTLTPEKYARGLRVTTITELILQKFSYGLFQTMGAVCRELGYEESLPLLLEPLTNTTWGVQKIAELQGRYKRMTDVISAYNQGSPRKKAHNVAEYQNQDYVDKVYALYLDMEM